jgi:RNA polymerase sigma-70 factor (ECF subfamily)
VQQKFINAYTYTELEYRGYTAQEIASILKKNPNTVYTHLTRARNMLKDILGGEADE